MDLAFLGVLAAPFFSVVFTLLSQTSQTQRPVGIFELHIHFTTQSIVIVPDVYYHHKPRVSPRTCRYQVHSHAERVETSVTFVAEHHLILMVRLLTHSAGLTLHTLPAVC